MSGGVHFDKRKAKAHRAKGVGVHAQEAVQSKANEHGRRNARTIGSDLFG